MPIDVLEKARAKNVDLSVVDGRLKVRAKPGALDDELRQEITLKKDLLIELLSEIQSSRQDQGSELIKPVARNTSGSPLSFSQQRLWFIDQHEAGSSQYNIPTALTLRGDLNKGALQQTLNALLERHEVLRTTYAEVGEAVVQVVNPAQIVRINEVDLSGIDKSVLAEEVEGMVRSEANMAFDLRRDPMLRANLLKLTPTEYVLLFTMHHIASDGWSVGVLTREFVALYEAFHQGRENPLTPLDIQYVDFAHWQRETLRSDLLASQVSYWEKELAAAPSIHRLPLDRPRPAEQNFEGRIFRQHVDAALRAQLNELAREHGATLFMLLECAFALLLARWSHEDDIVIGTPIAGRTHSQLEPLIGLFINTLVFRHQLDGDQSFIQLLLEAKEKALNAYANQDVPFDMVVDRLQPKRSLSHSPLFQVLFALQNNEQASLHLPELSIGALAGGQQTIKFDLELAISENEAGLWLNWTYACSLFDATTIERLSASFEVLLRSIVSAPSTAIYGLSLSTQADAEAHSANLNQASAEWRDDLCLQKMFENHVKTQPHARAVIFEDTSLTYQELNERANKVAHWLIQQGVGPDTVVGLCIERSPEMVIGILATWKAGGAYLPIDPNYPQSRIDYILQDSAIDILLTNSRVADAHDFNVGKQLSIDDDSALASFSIGNPKVDGLTAANLAYVIYTSGSTGNPKGVCIVHRSLSHLSRHLDEITEHPGMWAWMTAYVFDASLQGLTRLGYGGCLLILDDHHKLDVERLASVLDEHPVDIIDCTPSIVESWFDQGRSAVLPDLIIGGEAITTGLWKRLGQWQEQYQRKALNVYGPTECCVDSTWTLVAGDMPHIGKPLGDTSLCVLSKSGQLLPVGIPGELHIGGVGLARGYLNRPDLTSSRFISSDWSNGRLYRTGDIVRWRADGNLEFLGRTDDQVKIRGFRIELGEIEQQLNLLPSVRASAVLAVDGDANQKRLVAYVVPRKIMDDDFSETEFVGLLRASMEQSIASYMVPGAFKVLPRLPLNASGKLDKKSLALLDATAQFDDVYAAPRNTTEALLCEIWQTLLRVEKVGIHDNFFQLGGDSILSIQVVARANKAGIPLTTRQLFASQTIAELVLDGGKEAEVVAAPQHTIEGELQLLPIQKAFFSLDRERVHHFNQTVLLVTPPSFEFDALREAVGSILQRHDALRLRFEMHGDDWTATHSPLTEEMIDDICVMETLPSDADSVSRYITQRCEHYQRAIDIGRPPLLRAVYFEGAETGRLLLVAHHLVVDGVSWRILLSDLEQAFRSDQRGQEGPLAAKTSAFQQWGAALAGYAVSEALQQERALWQAQFKEPVLPFPMDFDPGHAPKRKSSRLVRLALSEGETSRLLKECSTAYRTDINELLLSAVYLGMRRWTHASSLRVILEGHGREDLFDDMDTTQTVGWFTTTYPLTLKCDDAEIPNVIGRIKEQYRSIPNKGIGYGVLQHLAGDPLVTPSDEERSAQLVFNYLGQFDQTFSSGALFEFAPESAGTDIDPERPRDHPLELNGMVAQGKLQFDLSYSDEQFEKENVTKLASFIEDALRSVIDHCAPAEDGTPAVRRHAGLLTLGDFPMARVTSGQLIDWQGRYEVDNVYPATSMQQGMLYHSMLDAGAYVSQIYPTFTGVLRADYFRQAWQSVVDRYDIFRTIFVGEGEQLHQLVVKTACIPFVEVDLRSLSEAQQAQRFEEARQLDKASGFDVSQAPMLRIAVFQLAEDRFKVLWSSHHMLLDGWSTPLVYRDVMTVYHALLNGEAIRLPAVAAYSNYIAWLQAQDKEAAAGYWRECLSDLYRTTPLMLDQLPGDGKEGHQSRSIHLSQDASDRLQAFAKRSHTTVNTLMQLAWGLLLHRYSGEKTVAFGATISGRPAAVPDVESMVGLFINTIPVKISFEQTDVLPLLSTLHRSFQDSNDFGYLPLAEVQSHSLIANGTPLFDSLIAFENFPIDAAADASADASTRGLTMDGLGADEQTNYKLTLVATMQAFLTISCRYRGEDFSGTAVERMLEQLARFLTQLPISDSVDTIQLPDDEFHARLRRMANSGDFPVPATRPTVDLARQVVRPRTQTETDMLDIWQEVLAVEISSIRDGFFDLGGNSLKAMSVAGHVAAHFGIERSLKALFVHNTIESLSRYVDGQKQVSRQPIPVVEDGAVLTLSFGQQQLWVVDQVNGGSAHYNMPFAVRLRGELDVGALRESLEKITERHAVLRTVFARTASGPVQVVQPSGPLTFPIFDLTGLIGDAQNEAISSHMTAEASTVFDLERDWLLRLRLLVLDEHDHVLLLTMHHIASDGWSIGILCSEFVSLYTSRREGREAGLPELGIQYADYAHWQRSTLVDEIDRQWLHWERILRGGPVVHRLPLDKPRPAQQNFTGAVHTQVIGRDVLSALNALAKRHDATVFMALQSAFAALLSRWSGEKDIVLGSPVAGRTHKQLGGLIGFFVNTVVFRYLLSPEKSFNEILDESRQQAIDAFANQDIPLEMLVDRLQPERSLSHSPVVQVMFSLQNQTMGELRLPGLKIEGVGNAVPVAKFDLELDAVEQNGELHLGWRYATSIFGADTIERMAASFDVLLQAIVAGPERPLHELQAIEAPARWQVLESFNGALTPYPSEALVQHLFEAQVAAHPEAEAVVYETQSLSYGELNASANRLANHLIAQGVKPDDRIGICMERGVDVVVALMGVLKAGAAYVLLDPSHPPARLNAMLSNSAPVALLAQAATRALLEAVTVPVVCLDARSTRAALALQPTHNPDMRALGITAANLACVAYTSAPTDHPDGVMIEHRSVLNLWASLDKYLGTADAPARRAALDASIAFDASLRSLAQLMSGACVVLIPRDICSDGEGLLRYLMQQRVDSLDCTPTQLQLLMTAGFLSAGLHNECRRVLVGGEPIPRALSQRMAAANGVVFHNVYGLVECTMASTSCVVVPPTHGYNMGRPLANTRVYILDKQAQPVPVGVAGELYIGGAGVARGYLDNPELTSARFIEDSFSAVSGARMYKSGDLGRWLADGTIEYLGRNDSRVDIRGVRVELAEVEAVLSACAGVQDVAVLAHEGHAGDKALVAYVVMAEGQALVPAVLRARLAADLPEYMIPGMFVSMACFPKTLSGKLHRDAFPAPERERADDQAYEAPLCENEETLARIWMDLFALDRVGRNDNFFDIGGNSIRAIQTVMQANKAGLDIKIGSIFKLQTIRSICDAIDTNTDVKAVPLVRDDSDASGALSYYQRTVFESGAAAAGCWHMQVEVGADITETHFRQWVKDILVEHEALLAVEVEEVSFRMMRLDITRELLRTVVNVQDVSGMRADAISDYIDATRARQEHALAALQGPLLRASLFVSDVSAAGLLIVHRALLDNAQWDTLSRQFESACRRAMQ